jgi:DNA-binding transcriptional regulator YiaG
MKKHNNLANTPKTERLKCPVCEHETVHTAIEMESFNSGKNSQTVKLTARVSVRTCDNCGFQFTDHLGEDARHNAVCRHLSIMTPKEITTIRQHYKLSPAKFTDITRLDEASLARWENGELLQNGATDNFLYLLTFPENLERLKTRNAEQAITLQNALN